VSRYGLRQTSYIAVFFLLGDFPAFEFCADVSEHYIYLKISSRYSSSAHGL
jgi:hypothetical protein